MRLYQVESIGPGNRVARAWRGEARSRALAARRAREEVPSLRGRLVRCTVLPEGFDGTLGELAPDGAGGLIAVAPRPRAG